MENKIVSLFADSKSGRGSIERQRRLAEMLREEAITPINARGGQGPIPWTAVLAKGLQGLGANMQMARADEQEQEMARKRAEKLAAIIAPEDMGTTEGASVAAPSPMGGSMNIPVPTLEDTNASKRQQLAELIGMGIGGEAIEKQALTKMGFGEPMDPIKVGKNDRLYAPGDYSTPLVDAVPDAPEPMNPNQPFYLDANGNPVANKAYQEYDLNRSSRSAPRTVITNNTGPSGIDYGKPQDGTVWKRDPKTQQIVLDERGAPIAIPYQGGKPYNDEQDKAKADKNRAIDQAINGDVVVQDTNRILGMLDSGTPIAGAASIFSGVPGTPQRDAAGLVATIKANVGFDKLQAMRAASPTGGALGNVAIEELRGLQASVGDLDPSQSPEQFRRNVARVRDRYLDIVHGPGTAERMRRAKPKPPPQNDKPAGTDGWGKPRVKE